MKLRILAVLFIVGVVLVYTLKSHAAETFPDVDALAARMKRNQDVYQKIRDEALAVYAKRHPTHTGYEQPAQTAIRLSAYLWVWGDYYGEGLWKQLVKNGNQAVPPNDCDPLLNSMLNIEWYSDGTPNKSSTARDLAKAADELAATDYPAAFKLWTYTKTLQALIETKDNPGADEAMPAVVKEFAPSLATKAASWYDVLVKAQLPDALLHLKSSETLNGAQGDETDLKTLYAALDQSLAQQAPDGVVRATLKGVFYKDYAWNARGSGWASTVTQDGNHLFEERLSQASDILEAAYLKFPDSWMIPYEMLTVERGQGKGRDRMETWFARAQKADLDNPLAYDRKVLYLMPRWYGSPQDLWQFGMECAKSPDFRTQIFLVEAISKIGDDHPELYANPKVWASVEQVFRGYLEKYPHAVIYRSRFAKYAVQGSHWPVAKEQFKLLGDDWDPSTFSKSEYAEMTKAASENASAAKTGESNK